MGTKTLFRFDEINQAIQPVDSLGAISPLSLVPSVFGSQQVARRALGFGAWNYSYACEDAGNGLVATWGGTKWNQSGSPLYRRNGVRAGDHAVGAGHLPNGNWFGTGAPTPFQATAAEDFAWMGVVVKVGAGGGGSDSDAEIFESTNFGGPFIAVRYIDNGGAGYSDLLINDGVDTAQIFVSHAKAIAPYGLAAVLERSTNKMRLAICPLSTGIVQASGELDASAIGNVNHAGAAYTLIGARTDPTYLAHFMICQGVDAAKGVSANISTVLSRYVAAILAEPQLVDAASGRGRSFAALSREVYEGADVSAGTTLATRDASVQALVRWDAADQAGAVLWSLTKVQTGVANAWDGGISSVETFAGDGYVEQIAQTNVTDHMFGLSDVDTNVDFATIDYAIFARSNATVEVYENGVVRGAFGAYAVGDILRVERVGTTITYKKNGNVFYTSGVASAVPLLADFSFFTSPQTVSGVRLASAGVPIGITWQKSTFVIAQQVENIGGVIYSRGKGNTTSEYVSAGVEVRPANATQKVGELRWLWQTSGGVTKREAGGYFAAPTDGSYVMLTATRRWVSPTSVILRHYLGDRLLSEVETVDGDIGGSTSGTTQIGGRQLGGYPRTAAAASAATGGDVYSCGWLFEEASGNLAPEFGGVTLTPTSTPVYGKPGPRIVLDGTDAAVGFDSALDAFGGGDNFDADAATDLVFAGVSFLPTAGADRDVMSKIGGGAGWYLYRTNTNVLVFVVNDGVDTAIASCGFVPNVWFAWKVVMDRAANLMQIATQTEGGVMILGGAASIALIGDISNASALAVGNGNITGNGATVDSSLAALFMGASAGAGAGGCARIGSAISTFASSVFGGYGDFFDGVIDGLRVVDYEMSREEIEATWKRISKYQPDGYRRMNDLMQPGLPISDDPSSRVQSDIRTMGTALGYGDAQIENVRENMMPDRAYGRVLERWEGITQRGAKPSDSVDKRRARVTGHIGKRDGVSPPGVANATAEVLATTPANIPIIAFSNTIRDPFIAVEGERWLSGLGPTPIGLGTTTVAGTRVTKNAGVNGVWDAGCSASTRIIGDGRIDTYQQAPNANEKRLIGFTDLAAPTHSSDIKWALYFGRTASSDVEVFENSIGPFAATSFALDDLFTIRRRGDTIEYMKNETVFYTSLVKSTAALALDLSLFNTTPSYFPDVRMMKDAASEVEIIFDSRVNVGVTYELISPYGARVERTAGGGIWNGKTRSNESIAGDGYVEVFVNSVAIAYRSFAFTVATDVLGSDLSENSTDYCIGYCDVGPIWRAVERGVIVFSQAVAVGDVLRIERIGSVVVYKKNGAIQYTSTVQTVAALVVDTQFFGASAIDALRLYDAGVRVALTFAVVSGAVSSASGDSLRMNGPGLNVQWDPSNANGMRCVMPVEAPRPQSTFYNQLHAFCALDLVTANTQIESGIVLWNPEFSPQCMCFFGVRYNAGTVQVGYEYFRTGDGFGFDQAWTVLATTSQTKHWLRVRPRDGAFGGGSQDHPYQLSWSTTGNQEANFSHSTVIQYRRYVGWWGLYTRSINGTSPVFDIRFSEVAFRNGLGSRPFYWYALRDPALPGVPDVQGARPIASQLAQAFTVGHVCSRKSFLLDDPLCTCDGGPLGGL